MRPHDEEALAAVLEALVRVPAHKRSRFAQEIGLSSQIVEAALAQARGLTGLTSELQRQCDSVLAELRSARVQERALLHHQTTLTDLLAAERSYSLRVYLMATEAGLSVPVPAVLQREAS